MPAEYAALGHPSGPEDWSVRDVVSTATLIGAIFGKGGGSELDSALALQSARKRFGRRMGTNIWHDFHAAEDPEAPVTVLKKSCAADSNWEYTPVYRSKLLEDRVKRGIKGSRKMTSPSSWTA